MLWIITIITFIIGSAIVIIKTVKEFKDNKRILSDYIMDFVIGMISTLIGVTLAIALTNYDTNLQEKEKNMALLRFAYYDIKAQNESLNSLEDLFEDIGYENFVPKLNNHPIRKLSSLDILDNPIAIDIIFPALHIQMLDIRNELNSVQNIICNDNGIDNEKFIKNWKLLKLYYDYMEKSIYLAIVNITGEYSSDETIEIMKGHNWYVEYRTYRNMGYSEQDSFDKATIEFIKKYGKEGHTDIYLTDDIYEP